MGKAHLPTWRDLLTAYDGEVILYEGQTATTDAPTSGNPISYYNGTRWAFDWDNGRQLVSAESNNYDLTFEYDHNGIRISKTEVTEGVVTLEHNWTEETIEATCTEGGYTLHSCSCGNSYQSDQTSALGHSYIMGVCTRCGAEDVEVVIPTSPSEPSEPIGDIMSVSETDLTEGCPETRTQEITIRHDYIYATGKLLRETITTTSDSTATKVDVLDFYYDQNGRPYSFTYNGTEYYYILNLQGDVAEAYDANGTRVAYYVYNAWGEIISKSGTMADINPIRYRGYYYDNELEMYYLQSRYYDPAICRFINADGYASTGQGFIGYDMFVYCLNNSIILGDAQGEDAIIVINDDVVFGAGHIGILVQDDEGQWWHFYWGPLSPIEAVKSVSGAFVFGKTFCVKYEGRPDVRSINASEQYDGEYTRMIYITGDFSEAVESMDVFWFLFYNLYINNCAQMSTRLLAQANDEFSDVLSSVTDDFRSALVPKIMFNELEQNYPSFCPIEGNSFVDTKGRMYMVL